MSEKTNPIFDNEVQVLTRSECLRLLRENSVGCLGLSAVGAPQLRPVNYVLEELLLIIRTGAGPILEAGAHGLATSFQIFGIDALEHTGWSVMVTGKLSQVETSPKMLALPLRPWASGVKDCFVVLSLTQISGRRIPPGRGKR